MIEPITEIDLDYRLFNKSKGEIKDALEQIHEFSRVKGVVFYKVIIKSSRNKPNAEYITNLCKIQILRHRIEKSLPVIAIVISIVSIIISIYK